MKQILTIGLMMIGWVAGIALAQDNPAVNKLFSNHVVLQRDRPVPVWGTAKPGTKITVKFGQQEKTAETGTDGKWLVRLDALKASAEPAELTIKSATADKPVIITDVLVGDVWLCSGQSNMEWGMNKFKTEEDVAKADFPKIRQTKFGDGWVVCSPQTAGDFSATSFYFGRRIFQETGIPVGLLYDAVGATKIESWIPPEGVKDSPALKEIAKEDYSKLFTQLTQPLIPFAIKGMIWYQGEANADEGDIYMHKMIALITGLRKVWAQGDFPFYFVQLPALTWQEPEPKPEGLTVMAPCRMAQFKALRVPNTGMAVTIDLGEAENLHPNTKFDAGNRLALWALAKDYGRKDLFCSGPLYKGMKIEGNKIRISFDYVGKGLMVGSKTGREPVQEVADGKLKRFAIAAKDGAEKTGLKWFWAEAVIDGDSVVVSCPEVQQPVAVHYAYNGNPSGCNLYNKNGLPASPFRTED